MGVGLRKLVTLFRHSGCVIKQCSGAVSCILLDTAGRSREKLTDQY